MGFDFELGRRCSEITDFRWDVSCIRIASMPDFGRIHATDQGCSLPPPGLLASPFSSLFQILCHASSASNDLEWHKRSVPIFL